ncbi:hypothetical protein QR46_4446 [Giardia duodenalis assemblage B]|uniref:Uncharacterized protein n=1 Tax=Giardia duodenalis assemblage B TaxID=1394984 RepID=A0A132NNJ4_GIAIN|nr:hypothetical protein QR46_4446 [Giardia intestinalis assemblage B]
MENRRQKGLSSYLGPHFSAARSTKLPCELASYQILALILFLSSSGTSFTQQACTVSCWSLHQVAPQLVILYLPLRYCRTMIVAPIVRSIVQCIDLSLDLHKKYSPNVCLIRYRTATLWNANEPVSLQRSIHLYKDLL